MSKSLYLRIVIEYYKYAMSHLCFHSVVLGGFHPPLSCFYLANKKQDIWNLFGGFCVCFPPAHLAWDLVYSNNLVLEKQSTAPSSKT